MSTVQQQYDAIKARYTANYLASRALTADINVPAPPGLHYHPFQKAGIAYMHGNDGVLLADEPGLGKTIQVLGLINYDEAINNILIICPASLKTNWLEEAYKWLTRPLTVSIANGVFPPTNIIIVNYDVIERYISAIHARKFDLIVVDEAHALRNPESSKASLILGNKAKDIHAIEARKRIFLTGTPIVNRPAELWPIISYLNPKAWSSWEKFANRFCRHEKKTRSNSSKPNSGASDLDNLQKLLRASLMIRRMKREVLYQLPKKTRRIFKVTDEEAASFLKEEKEIYELHQRNVENLRAAVLIARERKEKDRKTYEMAIAKFKDGRRVAMADFSRMRHKAALLKLPHVIKHVNNLLQKTDQKFVIFAHHSDVIDQLLNAYGTAATCVRGTTPNKERQENVKRFQSEPSCRIFVGSISAAGTGFTLTAAHHVIFAEICYISADLQQAEDRSHRIGQVHDVTVDHILLDESIEVRMAQIVIEKQRIADEALDYKLTSAA